MNITIIPVGNIDDEVLKSIASVIGGTFNLETEIAGKKAVPKSAYNARRKQFSAHEFIEIAKQENGGKILAITDVDIYAKNLNFVFGQAELKGKACVVSTHRLATKPGLDGLLIKRACKEAVHELGHTFGLHHCSDMSCVMCFSPNVEGVDAKNVYFCSACIEKYARSEKV